MAVSDFVRAARDPFFSPGQFQKDPQQDWSRTPVIGGPGGFLEQNPEAVWTRYLSGRFGVNPLTAGAQADWLRGQRQAAQTGFMAAQADDPTLTFQRYLGSIDADALLNAYLRMAPGQRGENWSRAAGPPRWLSDL